MKMDELVMAGFARTLQIDLVATQFFKAYSLCWLVGVKACERLLKYKI